MAQVAIDTLRYAKKLESAGIPQAQAEALAEAMESNLATKHDITEVIYGPCRFARDKSYC